MAHEGSNSDTRPDSKTYLYCQAGLTRVHVHVCCETQQDSAALKHRLAVLRHMLHIQYQWSIMPAGKHSNAEAGKAGGGSDVPLLAPAEA